MNNDTKASTKKKIFMKKIVSFTSCNSHDFATNKIKVMLKIPNKMNVMHITNIISFGLILIPSHDKFTLMCINK
jgi:hypothetical protein